MPPPPKRTHEDAMPLPPGDSETDDQPAKRHRRRERQREREKAARAQQAHELSIPERVTPLVVAEQRLVVATARLDVMQLRLHEQERKQQLTLSAPPMRRKDTLSVPLMRRKDTLLPTPKRQEASQYTPREDRAPLIELLTSEPDEPLRSNSSQVELPMNTSRENRVPIVEQFTSDFDEPPHPSPPKPPPIAGGKQLFMNTSRENRAPIVEHFTSDFSDRESVGNVNLLSKSSTPKAQESSQPTRPQKHTTADGLLSSCVQVPSTQQDIARPLGPAEQRRKPTKKQGVSCSHHE